MQKRNKKIIIVGAGLAGCEAAFQAADRGFKVELFESKPNQKSAAHHADTFSELVCSNSLKSEDVLTAHGLLKAEMRLFKSLILFCADKAKVPAGGALAVDREEFSRLVTSEILSHKNISVKYKTVDSIADVSAEDAIVVAAAGPLALGGFLESLESITGGRKLFFYDAAAPVIAGESVDFSSAFYADRYGRGEGNGDYVNCHLTAEEYYNFINALLTAEKAELRAFEKREIFDGCMPVEIMASRGADTLRFGPLKPVGIIDPHTGKRPFAVVQLRKENMRGGAFNIVGFQTNLKFGEQKRVFGLIPALRNAEFLRYGVMHRNSFFDAPSVFKEHYKVKNADGLYIAGQLSGVEGYMESAASGLIAGISAAFEAGGDVLPPLPEDTLLGALERYLQTPNDNFQPMNANFGLLPRPPVRSKIERKQAYSVRSLTALKKYIDRLS
jgi:methylenetetrahydrofolate--tRNA-(uracil-5-)-methyltransferase